MLLSAGAVLTVVAVEARPSARSGSSSAPPTAHGPASSSPARAGSGLSVAAGTAVTVTAISTGWVLVLGQRGDRLRPEPDRRGPALQRADHAMSRSRTTRLGALGLALARSPRGTRQAGRSCEQRPLVGRRGRARHGPGRAARRPALDQTGARVVVLARAGQDLTEYGLRYSHLGFAYRDGEHGPWRVVHKLNQCGSSRCFALPPGPRRVLPRRPVAVRGGARGARACGAGRAGGDPGRQRPRRRASTRRPTTWSPTPGPAATSSRTSGRSRRWR